MDALLSGRRRRENGRKEKEHAHRVGEGLVAHVVHLLQLRRQRDRHGGAGRRDVLEGGGGRLVQRLAQLLDQLAEQVNRIVSDPLFGEFASASVTRASRTCFRRKRRKQSEKENAERAN